MPDPLEVDVLLCTFRRESVRETLASLARQALPPGVRLRAIVADNDETPSARERVETAGRELGLDVLYLHAPARNISIARNAALEAARAPWVAFLDDDEVAEPDWMAALLASAEATGADAVMGPVRPVYREGAPGWMAATAPHATEPVRRGGRVVQGYTSNALVRREAPPVRGERFDPALGRSGGEDTAFFARLLARGAVLAYAPDAVVSEEVPVARESLGWLLRRRFRYGQTHGALVAGEKRSAAARLAEAGRAGAKLGFCALALVPNAFSPARRGFWLLRGALHAGALSRLLGKGELTLYGADPTLGAAPGAARR